MSVPPSSFSVLPLGGTDMPAVVSPLDNAIAYFRQITNGQWEPDPVFLPALTLDHRLSRYASVGGLSVKGPNSRDMLAAALEQASQSGRDQIAATHGRLIIQVPYDGFRPHVWQPYRGGAPLGQRRWCTSYAVIPTSAPLGAVAHELGHLLMSWPEGSRSAGKWCLMATGGLLGHGAMPAQPAAPLLLECGWREVMVLTAQHRLRDLRDRPQSVARVPHINSNVIVELRCSHLLIWSGPNKSPSLLDAVSCPADANSLVYGLISPSLRRLSAA